MILVQDRQSLEDIALQEHGNFDALLLIAKCNNVSIAEELASGLALEIPDSETASTFIVREYFNRSIKPATAASVLPVEETPSGISHWAINEDFIVAGN